MVFVARLMLEPATTPVSEIVTTLFWMVFPPVPFHLATALSVDTPGPPTLTEPATSARISVNVPGVPEAVHIHPRMT